MLKGRDDVQIVGDRFVFQSEVLFAQGQAEIGIADGQEQLAKLAIALGDIARKFREVTSIGFCRSTAIRMMCQSALAAMLITGIYRPNARLSVVRYLNQQGLPANRLAAAGYGEYQPLDANDSAMMPAARTAGSS